MVDKEEATQGRDGRGDSPHGAPPSPRDPDGEPPSSWDRFRQALIFAVTGHQNSRARGEDFRKAVVLSAINSIGVITIVALAFVAIRQQNWALALADAAVAILLVANQLYMRWSGNVQRASAVGVGLAGVLFLYLFVSGGAFHTGHLWYYVFPPVCSYVLGARRGLLATVLLLVPTAVYLLLVDAAALGLPVYSLDFNMRFIPSFVLVATYSFLAESSRERKHAEVARTVDELERTSIALARSRDVLEQRVAERTAELVDANERLKQEIAEREREREDRRRLEQQLQHAQKMEAIGTLAGGIAHDFNNLLVPIIGYAQLVDAQLPDDSRHRKHLDVMMRAAERAQALVRQILSFSRKRDVEFGPLQLQPLVKEALGLLRASRPPGVAMKDDIDPQCGQVLGEPTLIHQALLNLGANAFHAMKDTGGVLEVSLEQVEVGPNDRPPGVTLEPGSYACLTVRDTGHGMSPDTLERVFDPYFTTKPLGEGTGLGLSVLHGMVRRHDGEVTVESSEGEGTIFSVWLPLVRTTTFSEEQDAQLPANLAGLRVLLVDDEEMVRDVAGIMLMTLGCRVTTHADSSSALDAFANSPDAFDLVITDHSMPQGLGTDLVRKLRELRPELPVVLSTGYADDSLEERMGELDIQVLLPKPFTLSKLAAAIMKAAGESR